MYKSINYLKEILFLLENSKKKFLILILFTLIISLFDIIGLSLIAPYISIILEPNNSNNNFNFAIINIDLSIFTKFTAVSFFSMIIFVIYLFKTILSILINRFLLRLSFGELIASSSFFTTVLFTFNSSRISGGKFFFF